MCAYILKNQTNALFSFKFRFDLSKKRKKGGLKQKKRRKWDHCHTAESLLWRGERDRGRTGRTNRWRGNKKKGGRREEKATLPLTR